MAQGAIKELRRFKTLRDEVMTSRRWPIRLVKRLTVTNYGRPVYEMEDSSRCRKYCTFKYKGKIINITIHGGRQYSQNELIDMLDANDIKPTSTHSTFEEAEKAARERSDNMTMHKARPRRGVMMAQQGQTTLPMTQATSAPQLVTGS